MSKRVFGRKILITIVKVTNTCASFYEDENKLRVWHDYDYNPSIWKSSTLRVTVLVFHLQWNKYEM